jgi:pilus assembly protein CpaF
MATLSITYADDRQEGVEFTLKSEGQTAIGRVDDNDVALPNKKVSRRHAAIVAENGTYQALDLGSTFGTRLNGRVLKAATALRDGDCLDIGGNRLIFHADAAVAARPSASGAAPRARREEPVAQAFGEMAFLYTEEMMAMKRRIHEQVLQKLNLPEVASQQIQDDELRLKLEVALDQILREVRHELPRDLNGELFRQALLDELVGFGPISPMLRDPDVDEIMVNGPACIFVERKGRLCETGAKFFDDRHLTTIIQRIVEPLGRHVDEASPMVDARLPDGSRVNAVIPPLALDGSSVTIRKFARERLEAQDLIRFGSMTSEIALFLEEAVRARQNILISGGTGSGKTTLLNVLSQFIGRTERVVTIEDSAELKLTHRNLVRMEARPANIEGRGRVSIRDLVVNALRMRPDRIIVGECRGAEALDMLQAMNTGHDGSLTTVHANNPRDSLARLETMVMMAGYDLPSAAIRDQIASAVNLVVQQNRLMDGSRKILQISEITGREGPVVLMQDIFTFEQTGFSDDGKVVGRFNATGNIPQFVEALKVKGDLRLGMEVFVPKG